ncbi:MAG TPA: Fur family transcriptional regulator [Chitinispirillaceae bacterium]|nr:Fur family transcriptional regulator [Chitinispirillaceae bacterium]
MEQLIQKLRSNGFKITPNIRAVLALFHETLQYLSVQQIQNELEKKKISLGFPTIYRILERLEETGIILSFKNNERQIFYFLCRSPHISHHHHFICKNCKTVKEVTVCTFNEIQSHIETELDALVENHSLYIEGLCSLCKNTATERSAISTQKRSKHCCTPGIRTE